MYLCNIYLFFYYNKCVYVHKRPPNISREHTLGNIMLEYKIEFVSKFNFIEPAYAFSQFPVIWLHVIKRITHKKRTLINSLWLLYNDAMMCLYSLTNYPLNYPCKLNCNFTKHVLFKIPH